MKAGLAPIILSLCLPSLCGAVMIGCGVKATPTPYLPGVESRFKVLSAQVTTPTPTPVTTPTPGITAIPTQSR